LYSVYKFTYFDKTSLLNIYEFIVLYNIKHFTSACIKDAHFCNGPIQNKIQTYIHAYSKQITYSLLAHLTEYIIINPVWFHKVYVMQV